MPTLEELLARFHDAGDTGAMEEIVARTRPRLASAARRIGGQEADDAVQMAYHSLLRRGGEGFAAPVLPWLLTAVVRIAYRRKALAARQSELADRLACPRPESDPVAHAERTEECRLLRAEIAKLPDLYRDVVVLHHLEGLSVAEIARLVAAPPSTVKARLRRGRLLLRGRLDPRLRYGALALPWWLADRVRAIPASAAGVGAVMKGKLGVVVVVVLLLAAGGVAYGLRAVGDRGASAPRAGDRNGAETAKRPLAVEGPGGGDEDALPPPVDLDAVDLDRDLHGVVVDEDGAPVPGAAIDVVAYPWRRSGTLNVNSMRLAVAGPRTRAARDGTFRLGLRRGALVHLRVRAEGFASVTLPRYQAGERVRVVLAPGVDLHVAVRDERGEPVPATRLRVFVRRGLSPLELELTGTTGDDGRFTFANLPRATPIWVEPEHDVLGHPGWGWVGVDLPAAGAIEKEIVLPAGRTLTGRVTDNETGAPVAGARVGMGWMLDEPTATDADGRYTLTGWMGNGTYEIVVQAKGYGEMQAKVGDRDVIDFALVEAGDVRGRIVDAANRPVAGALVAAVASAWVRGEQETSKGHAVAGPDGGFAIADLRRDMVHTLVVMAPGHGRTLLDFVPAKGSDLGAVAVPRGVSLEGRVVNADGSPAGRVRVELNGGNRDRRARLKGVTLPAGGGGPGSDYGEDEERFTDHLGRFRYPDLAPGLYKLRVARKGYPNLDETIELDADRLDLELRYPEGRPFAVLVVDEDGQPQDMVVVRVRHDGDSTSARTGKDGRATFYVKGRVVEVGEFWVLPLDSGERRLFLRPPPVRDVPLDQHELRVVLQPAATITGRAVLPDGSGFRAGILAVRRGDDVVAWAYTKSDGGFTATVPPDGVYDIDVAGQQIAHEGDGTIHDENAPFRGRRDGVAAGSRDVTVRVTPLATDRTLAVTVLKPDGSAAAGLSVYLPGAPHGARAFQKTDALGRVRFAGLVDRPDVVRVGLAEWMTPERLVAPAPHPLTPAGQSIELRLRAGRLRRGRVAVGGRGVPDATVVASVGGSPVGFGKSDADGGFEIAVTKEGAVTLSCEHADAIAKRTKKKLTIEFTD